MHIGMREFGKLLLTDPTARDEMLALLNQHRKVSKVWRYMISNGWRGEKMYGGYQNMVLVLLKIGFRMDEGKWSFTENQSAIKRCRGRGRPPNKLTQLIKEDSNAKQLFTELVIELNRNAIRIENVLRTEGFLGNKYFLTPLTIERMQRLYCGLPRRPIGRPKNKAVST